MSRTAEVALLYEKSKTAMLIGLGYLAAKDPAKAVRISVRIGHHLFNQFIVDSGFYTKLLKEEIVDPEIKDAKKWYAANRPSAKLRPGSYVTAGSWLPLILFGGYTVYAIEETDFPERIQHLLGLEMPGEGGDPLV